MGLTEKFTGLFRSEMLKDGPIDDMQADYTIQADRRPDSRLVTSTMSQEQLRVRRMNLIRVLPQ